MRLVVALTLAFAGCAATRPVSPSPTSSPASSPATGAAPIPSGAIDPDATNFDYPYPVSFYAFESQGTPVRMAYLDVAAPTPNGRVVLLLHGKNFSASAWATTIASLTGEGYRVIAPDQLGFGKSSKPAAYQYSFGALATHTRALLDSLGIARTDVVGHSMGGMLAVRYALLHPEATDKLVLVNPIGLEDYGALVPYRTVDAWYADELKQTPESIVAYQKKAYYDGAWKPEYEALTRLQAGWTRHPAYPEVAWASARHYDMILTQPVVHDLPRLRVPTRLIIGLRDKTALGRSFAAPDVAATMGDYVTLGKRAQAAIPGAELVELPGVGHIPQVEAFDAYEQALVGFLR